MDQIKAIIKNSPVVIGLIYVLIGVLWIQFSDQFVLSVFNEPEIITQIQSLKGWFFVLASGTMIYLLVRKNNALLGEAIDELRKSRDEFRATFEFAPIGIAHHKTDENLIKVNQALCEMLGHTREELLKLNFEDFIHPDDLTKGRELDKELAKQKRSSFKIEKRYRKKDGSYFPGLVSKSAVFNGVDEPVYLVVMLEDISKQKKIEKELRKSIEAKEVLLAEIHHRVRNNLALVSALFDLQAMYTDDERVHAILKDSHMRIKCLALVHESYADTEKTSHIDFGEYLNQLVDFVKQTFDTNNGKSKIIIKKQIDKLNLNINQAIPAGLLCNELLLNAYLNSFENIEKPFIEVELQDHAEEIKLWVSDNGKRKTSAFNIDNPTSLGMLIVKTLSTQLRGTIQFKKINDKNIFELSFQKRDLKGPSNAL